MRRKEFAMPDDDARALLARAPVMAMAGTDEDGRPHLRKLHGVVVDGMICFHASPKGEKSSLLGREVVVAVDEDVARLPSHFTDPEKACPATTLFLSAIARGTLGPVESPDTKARALQALMEKLQPDGGFARITADDPRYRASVKGILIAGFTPTELVGKAKLLQNRKPEETSRILEKLWDRGDPGDDRAVELVRRANPDAEAPAPLRDVAGCRLAAWLSEAEREEAIALYRDAYWNAAWSLGDLREVLRTSHVVVGAKDAEGRLVATARGVTDGAKRAGLYDVFVHPAHRGRGLGLAVVRLALSHGKMKRAKRVTLGTKDAEGLYRKLGFVRTGEAEPVTGQIVEMVLAR